jgi:hypothetical protein
MPVEVGFILLAVLVYLGFRNRRKWFGLSKGRKTSSYHVLLNMCLNDRQQAARLIAVEKKRTPGISDQIACRRAINRIKRANQ